MSEELTVVDYAKKAGQLNNKQILSLVGNVQGTVEFDGTKEVSMTTTIEEGDITNTKITFEELSITEGIKSGQKTGEILGEIVNRFEEIEKGLENKLEKTATATSAEKLSKGKNISLVGNVKGLVGFDGSKDVEIQTEIVGGDIKDTVVSFTELQTNEEINSGDNTGIIVGKIKKNFNDVDLHMKNKSNPHELSKEQLGLGNVENTSDLEKPISKATQSALDNKLDKNNKAKDSDLLDGKDGSYYAPIENPNFRGNIQADNINGHETKTMIIHRGIKKLSEIKPSDSGIYITSDDSSAWTGMAVSFYGAYSSSSLVFRCPGGDSKLSQELYCRRSVDSNRWASDWRKFIFSEDSLGELIPSIGFQHCWYSENREFKEESSPYSVYSKTKKECWKLMNEFPENIYFPEKIRIYKYIG